MENEIEQSLIEIRKAYRLLFDFQKRILDLIDFIGNSYSRTYSGGYPKFCNITPRVGKGKLDFWAWDWLNFYFYEFHFGLEKENNRTIYFSIFLVTDTGYYLAHNNNQKISKIDMENFETPSNSETKLIFVVGENMWESDGVFSDNFNNQAFILNESGIEENHLGKMIFKSYDLSKFGNQESSYKNLKDFEEFCDKNSINFKLQKKPAPNN